ncbi:MULTISPECIES: hypothetical protein [Marinobacter]|uniref:hypothetical protein n=1 Tax=Marinobacter TaxID=2742 RepID=UPI001244A56B|nr:MULTISPECIES: hypothetical protein [Marinobacter]MBL3555251.1 hypothetical protein [Marinobacter sp. JB05H06]
MSKRMSDIGLATVMLFAGLVLSACGGGGSSSSGSSGGGDGTLKAGLFDATIEYVGSDRTESATTYISPTGRFAVIYGGNTGVSIGTLSFDGTAISGTSYDYRVVGPEGFIEDKGDEGTISGTVRSQESATFSTADAEGEVNTKVTLQRQNTVSDRDISLADAAGTYVKGNSEVALNVGSDGTVDSQYYTDTTGCHLSGTQSNSLSVPDASINVFDITYTMSNCTQVEGEPSRNGEYTGLGFFGDQQRQMVFTAHNENVAMKFQGTK